MPTSRLSICHVVVLLVAIGLGSAQAQPAPATAAASAAPLPIEFSSVAQALAALQARDGNGTVVTHTDEWTIVVEPLASAQWSFTPPGHEAYPAVVRRVIRRGAGGASVETASLCEAPADACTRLLEKFATLNDRITQAVKARGRQGSSQP